MPFLTFVLFQYFIFLSAILDAYLFNQMESHCASKRDACPGKQASCLRCGTCGIKFSATKPTNGLSPAC
jgi:hypothetical protein